jgi:hypothetical protein
VTSRPRLAYPAPMLRAIAALLLCLVACSAGATSPAPGDDASADGPVSTDTTGGCAPGREAFVAGACVSATDANCGGARCASGQSCVVSTSRASDGGIENSVACERSI